MTFSKFVKVALGTEHEFLKGGHQWFLGVSPGHLESQIAAGKR